MKHTRAAAVITAGLLLAGCGVSGDGGDATSTGAGTTSATSSGTATSTSTSQASPPSVDCSDPELSQAEWIDNCSDDATPPPEGEGDAESIAPVRLGETYTYDDGLEVTVTNWRQGTDPNASDPYVVFDTTLENTGSSAIPVDYWETAIYGDAGKDAMSILTEEWEDNGRVLQPGAKDTVTATLDIESAKDVATVQFEFYDPETFETPRPHFVMIVNDDPLPAPRYRTKSPSSTAVAPESTPVSSSVVGSDGKTYEVPTTDEGLEGWCSDLSIPEDVRAEPCGIPVQ